MISRQALCCAAALALAFAMPVAAAEKTATKKAAKAAATRTKAKPVAKRVGKPVAKPVAKAGGKKRPAAPKPIAKRAQKPRTAAPAKSTVLRGPREVLTCRDGTEDRHARIAVVLVGGKTDSFAYYSKWKPRTCSIYLQRNRDASRWSDSGSVTRVNAERGVFMIEHGKGEYRVVFRDVDRERYCGMEGAINGALTVRRGTPRCEVAGIMEEGVPLGEAVAYAEAAAASSLQTSEGAAEAPAAAQTAAPSEKRSLLRRLAQSFKRAPSTAFPSNAPVIGD